MHRGVRSRTCKKVVYWTDFDDIKKDLEVLIAQHRATVEQLVAQYEKVVELQKTLNTMASNGAKLGGKVLQTKLPARRDSEIGFP
ncbi:hypothetical protein HAX54_018237, partial [Datura stramonium]|nr:hypothetical protein [Datura stramonium]